MLENIYHEGTPYQVPIEKKISGGSEFSQRTPSKSQTWAAERNEES